MVTRLPDDRVVSLNTEFTVAYGHTTESVAGMPASALHFVEDDRQATLDHHARGDISSVEVRIRSADGECRWAQADVARFQLAGEDVLLTTLNDIRDRKQAEVLIEEMARFPDMNPGPVLRLDLGGMVQRNNPAAEAVFGADVVGRCFWDIFPDFPDASREQVLAGGQMVRVDIAFADRWLRLTILHPTDADQIFVYGSDITNEKVQEEELAERARFPALNPGPVARLDADGIVIRANPAATALFDRETLQGLSWLDLCPDIDRERWNRIRESEGFMQLESQIGDRWFSFTLRHEPVADQVFVYGSDMTELKAAEQALAELARFPDMNPGPVCRLDREACVLLANRAARRLFGEENIEGLCWLDLVPSVTEEIWERILASTEAVVVEARVGSRELVLTHTPGPEHHNIFVYGSDVTREKEAERALLQSEKMATLGTLAAGIAHELNNPAAAAQRAAEQLESAFSELQKTQLDLGAAGLLAEMGSHMTGFHERMKEAAAGACDLTSMERADAEAALEDWLDEHGVETPWELAPVLIEAGQRVSTMTALMDQVGPAGINSIVRLQANTFRVYRLLEEIGHGAGRISEIVGAMKSYSYLGQAPVQRLDVNEGLRSTLVILRNKLKEGVTVEQELAADLPEVEAYGSELNQVWTNLLDNAVQAMGGRGTIRLRTRSASDRVIVEVEDDGPGIPPEHQGRVFDAFFTTKAPGQGTGLGLHTTYKIVVEKHGGSIFLESKPGRTCFTVELPLTPMQPLERTVPAPGPS